MVVPDNVQNIFLIFGGLGLFLFGMKMMMDGLEILAGNRLRTVIERATSNRFLGIGVGALVTVLIQSSTATSVMAVGFINAGLMTLSQAISLILGAHIGTTLTAHIFGLRMDSFAPIFIFIGLVLYLFIKVKGVKNFGYVLLGVGVLFFGLSVMGAPLREFAETPAFQSMLVIFANPFLAILAGFLFTAIIQSSTAATGILVTLYLSGVDVDFTTAAFLVLGISAGTTVTALIASFAGRRESRRAALANLIYITIGCIVFGILLTIFPGILSWFTNRWDNGAHQIAMFYTFFKVSLTILFLPFVGHLADLMYKIIPKRSISIDRELLFINADNAKTPGDSIQQATDELYHMGEIALANLTRALDVFFTGDKDKIDDILEAEASINYLQTQISSMLMQIENVESTADMEKLSTILYVARDLERIGDHAKNIMEYDIRTKKKQKLRLSEAAMEELKVLSSMVVEVTTQSLESFSAHSEEAIQGVYEMGRQIDEMCKTFSKNHIKRLKNEKTDPRGGVVFVGMLGDLGRCSDHAVNIAEYSNLKMLVSPPQAVL